MIELVLIGGVAFVLGAVVGNNLIRRPFITKRLYTSMEITADSAQVGHVTVTGDLIIRGNNASISDSYIQGDVKHLPGAMPETNNLRVGGVN